MFYRCHPNRIYWHIIKEAGYSCCFVFYTTKAKRNSWKHRDAVWIMENHNLGLEWRIVPCVKSETPIEYRESKKWI